MKRLFIGLILLFISCYKDPTDFNSLPFILCVPSGKPWVVEEAIIDNIDRTPSLEGQYMWFNWPITSDPNFGEIRTSFQFLGNWRYEDAASDDYLHINFPYFRNPFILLNNKWRVLNKWMNRIEMRDPIGNRLVIKVAN